MRDALLAALPVGPPGLRRDEVALLAGASVSWDTWLEQGRDMSVPAAALQRLAGIRRLDRAEAAHLSAPSSRRPPLLAWKPAVADLFVDFGKLEPGERNALRLTLLHPPYRSLMSDWEQFARSTLGVCRAARARTSDEAPFDRLVGEPRAAREGSGPGGPTTTSRSSRRAPGGCGTRRAG